ncbi:MAG TPA: ABC transporter permease [Hyphomicrobiales bacterium]|nr:ABC transporter permease [Hyphomicrobiales bacterium]
MTALRTVRLGFPDLLRLASHGLRAHPLRVVLSALGIAIGIGAMLAVVGISASSRAELNRQLDALGTNLLTVQPGTSFMGEAATLPDEAPAMIARLPAVRAVSSVGMLDLKAYQHDHIPAIQTGGIAVFATTIDLPATLGAVIAAGSWLDTARAEYPAVVLGSRAAARLGIGARHIGLQIWLGERWATVTGILQPITLASSLDLGVFMGWPAAARYFDIDADITTIFVRAAPAEVENVAALLGKTANPANSNEVQVSRPSDMLAARAAADLAFTGLLVGLGAVALLVGGIGVVNTMVISVLERRAEIGLRRSQGATRAHIRMQFLSEALLLSTLGGGAGVVIGALVTAAYAAVQDWPLALPLWAVAGGLLATLVIGGLGGLYPAMRAARLAPTEALTSA